MTIQVPTPDPIGGGGGGGGGLTDAELRAAPVDVSTDGLTDAELRASPVPVSGTVTVSDGSGPLTVDGTVNIGTLPEVEIKNDVGNPVPVSDGGSTLSIDDGGGVITVDGTVNVGNFPASVEIANDVGSPVPVSGTVSTNGLTDAQLRATAVPVSISGPITVTDGAGPLTVDGSVSVSNFPASVEISNDIGSPIPVSGTVTVTDGSGPLTVDGTVTVSNPGLTDTQLRATAVPVSGTVNIGTIPEVEIKNDVGSPVPVSAASLPLPTGAATEITLGAINTKTPALGQAAMVASQPVVIASNQSAVPVSGTVIVGPTVTPGTGATNLGKAEDAVHASGDVGVQMLGVRNDADAVRTSANGDYSPISVDSAGRLKVTGTVLAASAPATVSFQKDILPSDPPGSIAFAANANRVGFFIQNDSNKDVYLKFGAGATTLDYNVRVAPTALYELTAPGYNGIITYALAGGGSGIAKATEFQL